MAQHFGKTQAEQLAEESAIAREIVRELVNDIRVSQRQIGHIIYGLALNVENVELMKQLTTLVRAWPNFFLSDRAQDTTDEGGLHGTLSHE